MANKRKSKNKASKQKRQAKRMSDKISAIKNKNNSHSVPSVISDPRSMEFSMKRLMEEISRRGLTDMDDINAFMNSSEGREFFSLAGGQSGASKTELLLEEAFNATGPKRVKLAREIIENDPDCIDAYNILAEGESDPKKACRLYKKARDIGERVLSKELKEDVGHFWMVLETRPYMRSLAGLAECSWAIGKESEAIDTIQRMLELNPNDNQGMRDLLYSFLAYENRYDELEKLLDRYKEPTAAWEYSNALFLFATCGECPKSVEALCQAVKRNRHVPDYLLGRKQIPDVLSSSYSLGSADEAKNYCFFAQDSWLTIAGAAKWLSKNVPKSKPSRLPRSQKAKRERIPFDHPELDPAITSWEQFCLWGRMYSIAEEFVNLAPWEDMPGEIPFLVDNPFSQQQSVCVIIGTVGESFGILCYPSMEMFEKMNGYADSNAGQGGVGVVAEVIALEFVAEGELSPLDKALARELLWPMDAKLFPSFRSYIPGFAPAVLDEDEACFAMMVFDMALDFVHDRRWEGALAGELSSYSLTVQPHRMFPGIRTRRKRWREKRTRLKAGTVFSWESLPGFEKAVSIPVSEGVVWEAALVSTPAQVVQDDVIIVPRAWIVADQSSYFVLDMTLLTPQDNPLECFARSIIQVISQYGSKPQAIHLRAKKKSKLVKELCSALGIEVQDSKNLKAIDSASRAIHDMMRGSKDALH